MGDKVYKVNNQDSKLGAYGFYCPGCKNHHHFLMRGKMVWQFNGDMEKPTFTPSLVVGTRTLQEERCHLFVKEGRIQFLSDCYHDFAGKTVDMEDVE